MFTINETSIDNEMLIARATIVLNNGDSLDVTVPVKLPQTKDDVIAAIQQREINENKKYDALPILTAVKADLDAQVVGKSCSVDLGGKVVVSDLKVI